LLSYKTTIKDAADGCKRIGQYPSPSLRQCYCIADDEKLVLKRNSTRKEERIPKDFHLLLTKLLYPEPSSQVDDYSTVMSMARRDRVEIMAEILDLCLEPQTKTQVMYGTNLSWKMLQHYLSQLQSLRLLKGADKSTKYMTTKRGEEFLAKWNELQELL
jgi:predicted transcriptional regulator